MRVKPELGDRVCADICGLTGIVVATSTHITGCDRVGIQAEGVDKDGKPREIFWYDEMAVKVEKKNAVEVVAREVKVGGPSLPGQTPTTRKNPV